MSVKLIDRNELILEGLAYTVMGILVVFMILVIIMLVIKAMALLSGETKAVEKVEETKPVVEAVPVVTQTADDSELVAVITAAVAAAMGQSPSGFVVRSYKAVSGNAWNKAGRMDVLENRL